MWTSDDLVLVKQLAENVDISFMAIIQLIDKTQIGTDDLIKLIKGREFFHSPGILPVSICPTRTKTEED